MTDQELTDIENAAARLTQMIADAPANLYVDKGDVRRAGLTLWLKHDAQGSAREGGFYLVSALVNDAKWTATTLSEMAAEIRRLKAAVPA